jgi:hypothetical protein
MSVAPALLAAASVHLPAVALGLLVILLAVCAIYRQLRTVIVESERAARHAMLPPLGITSNHCVERILPLGLLGLFVATGSFWMMNRRVKSSSPLSFTAPVAPTPSSSVAGEGG